jgi:Tat protein translocase TatB subunit
VLDLSPEKIFVLGIVALVVLGPNRLPQAARTLGRMLAQLRSMSASLQTEMREALHEPNEAIGAAIAEFRPTQIRRSVRQAVTSTLLPPDQSASGPGNQAVPGATASNLPPGARPAAFNLPAGNPDDPALN